MEKRPDFKQFIQEGYGDNQYDGPEETVENQIPAPEEVTESKTVQGSFDDPVIDEEE